MKIIFFLTKLLKLLKSCFRKDKVIPHQIASHELMLRAIFSPLFFNFKKRKLNNKAFLPPTKSKDAEQLSLVSIFRRDYSSDSACKNSALSIKINQQSYIGFLSFFPEHISYVNALPGLSVTATVIYSPIDEQNNYRHPVSGNIFYTDDPGLPMHAEIKYSCPVELDNPNTGHRYYADTLLDIVKQSMHVDEHPNEKNWQQDKIHFISK